LKIFRTSVRSPSPKRGSDGWIAFARTGEPNHPGLRNWPALTSAHVETMFFDNDSVVRYDHDRKARLDASWLAVDPCCQRLVTARF
jgi:carboxylesterase type B